MASPANQRFPGVIIIGIIVPGEFNGQSGILVPEVLSGQCVAVVFRMACNEDLPPFIRHHGVNTSFFGRCKNLHAGNLFQIRPVYCGMTGVGNPKLIVKAPQQDCPLVVGMVQEYAKEFFRQQPLLNPIVVIQGSLCTPADVKGGMNMGFAPFHDPA